MQEELKRYSDRIRAEGRVPLQARVGLNTGEVVVRSITTGEGRTEYVPVGHSTGIAARMQAMAPVGSIAATEQVRKQCEGYFLFKSLGPTRVKGVSEPVNVYEATGLGPLRTRLQRAAVRGYTRFVSREAELKQMQHALELARNGHGQMVAAVGEPGVGKSRLFHEFKAVSQSGAMLLEAYSVSHGKASAYLPVTELLRDYFRIVPEEDARQRREKVAGKIVILDRNLEDTLPYLYALLGIAEGDASLAQMDAQILRRSTYEAIKRVLVRESLNQPLIVIFEDLHWIDTDTQALLEVLCDSIASSRVLLLVNYRPEYRHEWGSRSWYTQLRLDPLGPEDVDEMLGVLLGDAPELAALKHAIAARSEGNPFFIEEIVQALFEEGVLTGNGQVKLARPFSQSTIPTTVQAMLAARIDRLSRDEKELLQTLAVVGREISLRLAQRVAGCSESQLDAALARLRSAEFIHEQPASGDVQYTFKHALTRDVAYNSLLGEQRKLLHERIAGATESLFADHLDDHLQDLAYHYRCSNNRVKAVEHLRRAGEQAVLRGFYEEAMEQLHGALEILEKLDAGKARDSRELGIRRALMGALVAVRSLISPEIPQNAERLRALCEEAGDTRLLAEVLLHLFFYHRTATSLDKARPFARQGLELAEQTSGESEVFCGNFSSGLLAMENGEYLAARQHFERALGISQQTRDLIIANPGVAVGLLNCVGDLAIVCWILGYPDQAQAQAKRLAELLRRSLPANAYAAGMYRLLTMRCDFLHNYQDARANAQEALGRSTQGGFRWGIMFGTIILAGIMVAEGATDPWLENLATEMRAAEILDQYLADWLAAGAYLNARRVAEGREIVDRAIAQIAAGGARQYEADLHRLKGEFTLLAGEDRGDAEAAFKSAITIAHRQQAKGFELRASISLARVLAQQGRRDEARASLAEIYNWFTEGFDTADLKDAKALLEELST
jgi:tetratricopeptide (TPR) repeat protein